MNLFISTWSKIVINLDHVVSAYSYGSLSRENGKYRYGPVFAGCRVTIKLVGGSSLDLEGEDADAFRARMRAIADA